MKRTASTISALLLALVAFTAAARQDLIFKVRDPFGDDRGDGSLRYPRRSDFAPGDLDVLEFMALRRADGTVFRIVFARDIRDPGREAVDGLGTPREAEARHGFYAMNVDLYVDVDRQPGSGEIAMLPGRKAEVAPPFAYEKAIAVTPRPEALRASIHRLRVREWTEDESRRRTVSRREVRQRKKQIVEELLPLVYFPNRIRVRGRQLDVFVPEAFLGGEAQPTWGYVLVVTGARLSQRLTVPFFGKYAQESSDGLVMPVVPGSDDDAFGGGRDDDPLQPPLVDVLVPPGAAYPQEAILRNYDSSQERPVQVPGVVPAEL